MVISLFRSVPSSLLNPKSESGSMNMRPLSEMIVSTCCFVSSGRVGFFANPNEAGVERILTWRVPSVRFYNYEKYFGMSVRCVRDAESGGTTPSNPTLSVTPDATNPLTVCGSSTSSVTYTASITDGELSDYNYTWSSNPSGTAGANGYTYTVTYSKAGVYTVSCAATPQGSATSVEPAYATVTVGGCPCSVTSVGDNEVAGTENGTIVAVKDAQNNQYSVVKIGGQCWMAQNLRSTSEQGLTEGSSEEPSATIPYYYDKPNSNFGIEERGYLYNWTAVMNGASGSNLNPSGGRFVLIVALLPQ